MNAESRLSQSARGTAFMWLVSAPVLLGLAWGLAREPSLVLNPDPGGVFDLIVWIAVIAAVELLPVPLEGVLRLSLSFPILLGVAILYDPLLAGGIAFVGSFDSREINGEISPLKALFNRSQIAVSTLVESALFHSLASVESPISLLLPSVFVATVANYGTNVLLVSLAMHFIYGTPTRTVYARLRIGALPEFLLSYVGLGLVGVVIARLYSAVSLWSVAAFILPLVFARQMFFRNLALEEAHTELKEREQVLRALSNRMAEERHDERMRIAAYLHDDLAQMLFRLTLQVEMAKKRVELGDQEALLRDLDSILETKQHTSDAVRALIRDLHRSPIGRKGLAEAIESFAQDVGYEHSAEIVADVEDVALPPPIQLLIYQIAREAAMNALQHANARVVRISLTEEDAGVRLTVKDNGGGFDTARPPPEGHFGLTMMRERAVVVGGTYDITSVTGRGTTVTATFPKEWVEPPDPAQATPLLRDRGTRSRGTAMIPGARRRRRPPSGATDPGETPGVAAGG